MFIKRAKLVITASFKGIKRVASSNSGFLVSETKLSDTLSSIASIYKISKDPQDYIFVVARAVTADVPNENKDAFGEYELLSMKKNAIFTYETFTGDPLLEEHDDRDLTTAAGFVIDTYYDDIDYSDRRVMTLLGIDVGKRKELANQILKGDVVAFSMGCIAGRTVCSKCGNVAETPAEFCFHIANKMTIKDAFEWCEDVEFKEISHVQQPADPNALSVEVCSTNDKEVVCRGV